MAKDGLLQLTEDLLRGKAVVVECGGKDLVLREHGLQLLGLDGIAGGAVAVDIEEIRHKLAFFTNNSNRFFLLYAYNIKYDFALNY